MIPRGAERLLDEGIERFNQGRFWDAHESWESIWLESTEPEKTFLQGLIQLTAACHHFQRGTLAGGIRLVDAAIRKLSDYPPGYMRVERTEAVDAVMRAREDAAGLMTRNGGAESALPDDRLRTLRLSKLTELPDLPIDRADF